MIRRVAFLLLAVVACSRSSIARAQLAPDAAPDVASEEPVAAPEVASEEPTRPTEAAPIDPDAPVVDAPVVDAPVVDAPVVDAPVVVAPTSTRRVRRWERHVYPVRRNALLYYPISALGRGLTLAYERALPDPRFTLLLRSSISFPAGRDFRSIDLDTSVEARFYPFARGPVSRYRGRAPVGLYVGFRVGVFHSRLVDRRDSRLVGTLNRLVTEASIGYRVTFGGRIEISPYIGTIFYADFISNLPPSLRPNLSAGATMGVLF